MRIPFGRDVKAHGKVDLRRPPSLNSVSFCLIFLIFLRTSELPIPGRLEDQRNTASQTTPNKHKSLYLSILQVMCICIHMGIDISSERFGRRQRSRNFECGFQRKTRIKHYSVDLFMRIPILMICCCLTCWAYLVHWVHLVSLTYFADLARLLYLSIY